MSFSSNRSVGAGDASGNNVSLDGGGGNSNDNSNALRGFGAIGPWSTIPPHPQHQPHESSRRRSASQDTNPFHSGEAAVSVAQKFGALPTLSSHLHQQQQHPGKQSYADLPKPRHIRSVSQPGNPNAPQLPETSPSRMYGGQYVGDDNSNHSYKSLPPSSNAHGTRSASVSYPVHQHASLQSQYGGVGYGDGQQDLYAALSQAAKSSTLPHLRQASYSGGSYMDRRDVLDFHLSPGGSQSSSFIGGGNDSYLASSPGSMSPHQQQLYYSGGGGHMRGQSDMMMSSQSMPAMGLGMQLPHRSHYQHDEDMSHPLMGEHIDVPDPQEDHHTTLPAYFTMPSQQHQSHPMLRGHAHSMSLDALPAAYDPRTAQLSMPKVVYSVKFKRSQRNFVLGPRISRDLKIGTYVKVEADRGEDLGIVVGALPAEKYNSYSGRASFTAGMGPPGGMNSITDLKQIVRLATHDEVSLLSMKRDEEDELLKICRAKVRQRGLPMNVVDAEYQFDRHKLTFFFEAEGRVDFRELVRDLFSMYKTRIWMQQLDKNTSTSALAITSPQMSNMLQMDYGTPIIAPPSEFADSIMFHSSSSVDGLSH
jgi:PSP1 C-terminal conserved region